MWTGLGATGTAILGMMLFSDPRDLFRIACLTLIIIGAVGLKFQPPPSEQSPGPVATVSKTVE